MKSIYFLFLLFLTVTSVNVYAAAGSILSVVCKGNDVGAEVLLNGKFKGECPLDIKVPIGTVKLKVHKKVDAFSDRIFEQEIYVGYAVVKRVEVLLGAPKLNAEGKRAKLERLKTARLRKRK